MLQRNCSVSPKSPRSWQLAAPREPMVTILCFPHDSIVTQTKPKLKTIPDLPQHGKTEQGWLQDAMSPRSRVLPTLTSDAERDTLWSTV